MRNRIELAQYFNQLGFKKGVEVGTCTGRYAKILLENIPNLQLLTVDAYVPYVSGGSQRRDKENLDNYSRAHQTLGSDAIIAVGFSHQVSNWIPDASLDFVFIDAGHAYDEVMRDLACWAPKVRKGGIVSGHDYYLTKRMRVKEAVDNYAKERGIEVISTGHDPEAFRDDRQPDFWWVVT